MEKPWRVSDNLTSSEEDYATEAEALAFAEELLEETRKEAHQDGEWADETGFLRVYRLTHSAQITKRERHEDGEMVDYGMVAVDNPLLAEITRLQSSLTLSREEGRRDGETSFICFMIDHYEGSEVTEEMLQRAYSSYLKAIRFEAKGERAECTWTLQDDETGAWASTCGELWSFIDGGPQENRVRFCHGCGKPVKAQPLLDTE